MLFQLPFLKTLNVTQTEIVHLELLVIDGLAKTLALSVTLAPVLNNVLFLVLLEISGVCLVNVPKGKSLMRRVNV